MFLFLILSATGFTFFPLLIFSALLTGLDNYLYATGIVSKNFNDGIRTYNCTGTAACTFIAVYHSGEVSYAV